jgi:hypothetical protein
MEEPKGGQGKWSGCHGGLGICEMELLYLVKTERPSEPPQQSGGIERQHEQAESVLLIDVGCRGIDETSTSQIFTYIYVNILFS